MENKNTYISKIKNLLKTYCNGKFFFPSNTIKEFWLNEEKVKSEVLSIYVKKDVLYIQTRTDNWGIMDEKFSEFDVDEVKDMYNYLSAQEVRFVEHN